MVLINHFNDLKVKTPAYEKLKQYYIKLLYHAIYPVKMIYQTQTKIV